MLCTGSEYRVSVGSDSSRPIPNHKSNSKYLGFDSWPNPPWQGWLLSVSYQIK